MNIVLDTCALIWWSLDPEKLSSSAQEACQIMERDKNGLVASISIWEIAIKVKNKKLDLGVPLPIYVETLEQSDVLQIVAIDQILWLKSVFLEWHHRDPADRVIVSLAMQYQIPIITSDKIISEFYSSVIW